MDSLQSPIFVIMIYLVDQFWPRVVNNISEVHPCYWQIQVVITPRQRCFLCLRPLHLGSARIEDFFKGLELGPDRVVICVNFQGWTCLYFVYAQIWLPCSQYCPVKCKWIKWWPIICTIFPFHYFNVRFTFLCCQHAFIVHSSLSCVFHALGRSTGQAYVEFASVEIADKALDRNRWLMLWISWFDLLA